MCRESARYDFRVRNSRGRSRDHRRRLAAATLVVESGSVAASRPWLSACTGNVVGRSGLSSCCRRDCRRRGAVCGIRASNTPNVCVFKFFVITVNRHRHHHCHARASASRPRARARAILERADGACSYRRCDVVGVTVGPRDVDDDEDHQVRRR